MNGNDSGASDSGIDVLKTQIADGFDESIIQLVERELKAHESNIVLGDQERSQWVGACHAAYTDTFILLGVLTCFRLPHCGSMPRM